MEWEIGEIKQVNGEWYQCVESKQDVCTGCAFNPINGIGYNCCGSCTYKQVIFKKLEKVGEPYEYYGYIYQEYHVFEEPIFTENYATIATIRQFGVNSKISIGIKQNKEDMEENKLDLKPFDLQKAKAGKPVCTRDGRKARIICFDKVDKRPIVALILDDGCEFVYEYLSDGKSYNGKDDSYDLMMLPEKKEGWIIVSKNATIYDSLEDAKKSFDSDKELCICKVEWEE